MNPVERQTPAEKKLIEAFNAAGSFATDVVRRLTAIRDEMPEGELRERMTNLILAFGLDGMAMLSLQHEWMDLDMIEQAAARVPVSDEASE